MARGDGTTSGSGGRRGYAALPAHSGEEFDEDRTPPTTARAMRVPSHDDEGHASPSPPSTTTASTTTATAITSPPVSSSGQRPPPQQQQETTSSTTTTTSAPPPPQQQQQQQRVAEHKGDEPDARDDGDGDRDNNDEDEHEPESNIAGDTTSASPPATTDDTTGDAPPEGHLRLRILDLNGKFFPITCAEASTVATLKRLVHEATEVAVPAQRLIYRGRVLEDDKPLGEYKVEDGHTIHLFVRMAPTPDPQDEAAAAATGAGGTGRFDGVDPTTVTIVHIHSDTISSAVFPSDSARRVDPLMLDSPLGNCARRVKLWSSFLLIIYTMKVMGQFALLANDQQLRNAESKDDASQQQDRYYDRYDYPPYYNQDPMISVVELVIHAFGVYVGCVGFKAAHDTDIRPIRFYCRGIVWLAVLTVAEQLFITYQISKSDYPENRIQYPYGPAAPSKEDIISANVFQTIMLVVMWIIAVHHSYAHQAEVAQYNQSFAAAAMNAVPAAHLPEVV